VAARAKLDGSSHSSIFHLHIFCFVLPDWEVWKEFMKVRSLFVGAIVLTCFATSAVWAQQNNCPFNISESTPTGSADALRDGVLLLRYARGVRGAALVAGMSPTLVAADIETRISDNRSRLDMNGNGLFDEDDATIISRIIFGYRDNVWYTPTLPTTNYGSNYASRTITANIKKFVDSGCAAASMSALSADQIAASRFLVQATFGPSMNDINAFLDLGASHVARRTSWLNTQTAARTGEKHFQYMMARKAQFDAISENFGSEMVREAFWKQALKNSDQLRQRMAFALSQIVVVSSNGGSNDPYELAAYLDILADNAFGNYKDILKKIALSPAQGRYLSHLRNDGQSANPNENFAREILQLFAVGLFQLDMNGEKVLDGSNNPIPSYDEDIVKGFAKIFTGFAFDDPYCKVGDPGWGVALANCKDGYNDTHPSWFWEPGRDDLGANFPPVLAGWNRSMIAFPGRHSAQSKQLLRYQPYAESVASCSSAIASAGAQTNPGLFAAPDVTGSTIPRTKVSVAQANAALDAGIDNIFCHPNVGPFISKHLIKFFVTSNPTLAYVGRVAAVFNNNGSNVRGDMKAVITAILTDVEAGTPASAPGVTLAKFGKLREPLIRYAHLLRAFNATKSNGRYEFHYGQDSPEYGISQAPLQSPTVFNYYNPEFSPPGHISAASALGPEFEITTTTSIAATQNNFGYVVTSSSGNDTAGNAGNLYRQGGIVFVDDGRTGPDCNSSTGAMDCLLSDYGDLYALVGNTSELFNYINLVLMGGTLPDAARNNLVTALDSAYPQTTLVTNPSANQIRDWQNRRRDRVKGALWLAVHMPEFQIQR
jgi:uncharacterized protein (DUF1800 family)